MTRAEQLSMLELETMLLSRQLTPLRRPSADRHLERSGYTLLARIVGQGPMSIGELSDALSLDVSTLNRQTSALVKQGYLERIPDPDGGVARKFSATAPGQAAFAEDRRLNVVGLGRLTGEWNDDDLDQFIAYLCRFNTDIEGRLGQVWPRGGLVQP